MRSTFLVAFTFPFALLGCAEQHEEHEFESRDECVAHYEAEGHGAEEIEELCADFAAEGEGEGE